MKVLKHWFWKYEIFFNDYVYQDVLLFAQNLTKPEKTIFLEEVNFFKSFYTFQNLLDAINNKDETQINNVLHTAKNQLEKITKLNEHLYKYYFEIIQKDYTKYYKELLEILDYSHTKATKEIIIEDYLKIIIGDNYNEFINYLKKEFKNKQVINYTPKQLSNKNIKTKKMFKDTYNKLTKDEEIQKLFGVNKIKKFQIIMKDIEHFGEFWNPFFYDDYKKQTLILRKGLEATDKNDFDYTIIHEVYPGHGHFFANLLENKNLICDTGALFLFEGYATVCELLIDYDLDYVNNLKNKYLTIIEASINKNLPKLNNEDMFDYMLSLNQYIGYYEAYYIGAFYILYLLEVGSINNIKDFFEILKDKNIGNFFSIWF